MKRYCAATADSWTAMRRPGLSPNCHCAASATPARPYRMTLAAWAPSNATSSKAGELIFCRTWIMIALAKGFIFSGKGFALLRQVAVWRFPIMLPGDVDVWEAIPLPSHALYVCKNCVYCSVQDKGGYVDASDSNQKRWIKQLQSLRPDVLVRNAQIYT